MLEGGSLIDPKRVLDCVQSFMLLGLEARREIAEDVLAKWDEVIEIFRLAKEAMASPELGDIPEEVSPKEEDEEGSEDEEHSQPVRLKVFMKALTEEEQGPFSQELLARLIMA